MDTSLYHLFLCCPASLQGRNPASGYRHAWVPVSGTLGHKKGRGGGNKEKGATQHSGIGGVVVGKGVAVTAVSIPRGVKGAAEGEGDKDRRAHTRLEFISCSLHPRNEGKGRGGRSETAQQG